MICIFLINLFVEKSEELIYILLILELQPNTDISATLS